MVDDQKQNYNITTWYNHTGTIEKTAHKYLVRKDQQIGAKIPLFENKKQKNIYIIIIGLVLIIKWGLKGMASVRS